MKNANAISLYAALQPTAIARPAFADQRIPAINPAAADPVSRCVICIRSTMHAKVVRKAQIRKGGECRPKTDEKTRKKRRSLRVRTVPSAIGANRTCMRSPGE